MTRTKRDRGMVENTHPKEVFAELCFESKQVSVVGSKMSPARHNCTLHPQSSLVYHLMVSSRALYVTKLKYYKDYNWDLKLGDYKILGANKYARMSWPMPTTDVETGIAMPFIAM